MADVEAPQCGNIANEDTHFQLRVASIFIVLVTSSSGALLPVVASRIKALAVHKSVFE
jgi:zinc transporter 1/2/3